MPRPLRLSLDMMETLIAVIESEGDAMTAARELDINQPSMSKRLATLQHSNPLVRFPWLEKDGKTWKLTPEGRRNYEAVQRIVRLSRTLQTDQDERFENVPDITLASGQSSATTFVREALLEYRKSHPHLRLRLSTPRGRPRIAGVANGLFDLAIVTHDEAEILQIAQRPLYVETLFTEPWVVICGTKAPKTLRDRFEALPNRRIDGRHLANLPILVPEADAGLRGTIDHIMNTPQAGQPWEPAMELGGWNTLVQYVRDGFGIGIVGQTVTRGQAGLLEPKLLDERTILPSSIRLIGRRKIGDVVPDWSVDAHALVQCLREAARQFAEAG